MSAREHQLTARDVHGQLKTRDRISLGGNPNNLEDLSGVICSNISELEEKYVPLKRISNSTKPRWFRPRVASVMRAKRRAFLRYTECPNQTSYRDYVRERDRVDWVYTVAREEYEERLAGVLTKTNTKSFFSYAKPQSARSSDFRMDLEGGISTQPPGEVAGAFQTFFSSVHAEDDHRPISFLPPPSGARMEDILVTSESVEHMLNRLPPNSAPDTDGIHPAMLRILTRVLAKPLARLFNTSLRHNKIPTAWKLANITPIFKKRQ